MNDYMEHWHQQAKPVLPIPAHVVDHPTTDFGLDRAEIDNLPGAKTDEEQAADKAKKEPTK